VLLLPVAVMAFIYTTVLLLPVAVLHAALASL
jgi:hypothetical protein